MSYYPNPGANSRMDTGRRHAGYSLTLCDGNDWLVYSDGETAAWLEKLATIMRLRAGDNNGAATLVFSRMRDGHDGRRVLASVIGTDLPRRDADDTWTLHKQNSMRVWRHRASEYVVCEVDNDGEDVIEIINMWNALQPVYQRSVSRGGLPVHSALAEHEGRGVLLAAPGDTGKSTCCCRLPDYWKPLCDDESLVVLDKQKCYRAHPFPTWSDYLDKRSENTWDVQYSVPLAGIFFLEQAETDEVIPLGEGQSAIFLYRSADQIVRRLLRKVDEQEQMEVRGEVFDNACQIAKMIPMFRLRASLYGRFWEEIEKVLC